VIDAGGKHVYPGLISANSVLGLTEISAVRATVDIAEPGTINPNASTATSINPDSELLPVARSNGILTALAVPEGGLLSGTSAVFRLDGWTQTEMIIRAPAAMHLQWPNLRSIAIRAPENAGRSAEGDRQDVEDDPRCVRHRPLLLARPQNAGAGFQIGSALGSVDADL
jgi:hypothetical protein